MSVAAISAGVLHTADGSVLVAVPKPALHADHWKVSSGILGRDVIHVFTTAGGQIDEDRLDTSAPFQSTSVTLLRAGSVVCTATIALVTLPAINAQSHVFILPTNASWPSVSIDDMQLSPLLTLHSVFAAYSQKRLHINGRLVVAGHISSSSLVDLSVSTASNERKPLLSFSGNGDIQFPFSAGGAGVSTPYKIVLKAFHCDFGPAWTCPIIAQLQLPPGVTSSTRTTISLTAAPNGVLSASVPVGSSGIPIAFSFNRSIAVSLSDFQVDPTKPSVTGDGTLTYGSTSFALHNLGFISDSTGTKYVPTGSIDYEKQAGPLGNNFFKISTFTGTLNLAGSGNHGPTLTANATLAFNLGRGSGQTNLSVAVSGLSLTLPNTSDPFTNPDFSQWKPDFSHATVTPNIDSARLFGHLLEQCDPNHLPPADPTVPPSLQFCVGVHLSTSTLRDPNDVAYGYLVLDPESQSQLTDPTIKSFSLTLPQSKPATIRFAAGKLNVTSLRVDVYNKSEIAASPYGGFDQDISTSRLDALSCNNIRVSGEAAIDTITLAAGVQQVSAVPRIGFSETCTVFALRGLLALQLTPQSNIQLTSLAFAHSQPLGSPSLDYLDASGTFTSGNVTIVFNSIGFRTFKQSDPIHCDRKDEQEYEIHGTSVCAIVNVNTPMTVVATGVQNSSEIAKLLGQAGAAILGFLAGKI